MPRTTPESDVTRLPKLASVPIEPTRARATRFALYRIALKLPSYTVGYAVTHGRPELHAEVLNRMELPGGLLLVEARVFGPGSDTLIPLAKTVPAFVSAEVHRESERSTLYRIKLRRPPHIDIIHRNRILTRYPITYDDGWMRFETLATPDQVRRLVKQLSSDIGESRVEAVRQGSVTASALGLTPSQVTVFREAVASGYFSAPRRTTLTQLAKRLGRSKSTVSQQIAMIQKRLAESAMRFQLTGVAPG
jgi:predicted DNA binding protein